MADDLGAEWESATPVKPPKEDLAAEWETSAPAPGAVKSAVIKFAQGATKGWVDELGGLLGRALHSDPIHVPGTPEGPSAYEMTRTPIRREQGAAQSAHPILSTIAQGAGELASDFLLSRAGLPVTSGTYQTISGAISGAGNSEEETPAGVALDAGIGGGLAAGTHGLAKYVAAPLARPVGTAVRRALQNFAGERAIKATGAIQGNIKGIPIERLREMGNQLLEHDIIPGLGNKEVLRGRAEEGLERVGALIGDTLKRADTQATTTGAGAFDWAPVLQRIRSEVWEQLGETGRRVSQNALHFAMDAVETAKRGEGYAAANRLKSEIQNGINWGAEPKIASGVAKRIQGILDDEIEGQLQRQLGGQVAEEFATAKSLYGAFKTAQKGSTKGLERQLGNRVLQPSDMALGMAEVAGKEAAGQGAAQAFPKVAALMLAHKLARERGAAVAAHLADRAADSGALSAFTQAMPGAFTRFAAPVADAVRENFDDSQPVSTGDERRAWGEALPELLQGAPDAFGKYAGPLRKAAKRGPEALAALDYALTKQDPEYARRKVAIIEGLGAEP